MADMKTVCVVRELVSVGSGEKEFRTHYEYGIFLTYDAADQCAIETGITRRSHRHAVISTIGICQRVERRDVDDKDLLMGVIYVVHDCFGSLSSAIAPDPCSRKNNDRG